MVKTSQQRRQLRNIAGEFGFHVMFYPVKLIVNVAWLEHEMVQFLHSRV
jgi:hypothetical protein